MKITVDGFSWCLADSVSNPNDCLGKRYGKKYTAQAIENIQEFGTLKLTPARRRNFFTLQAGNHWIQNSGEKERHDRVMIVDRTNNSISSMLHTMASQNLDLIHFFYYLFFHGEIRLPPKKETIIENLLSTSPLASSQHAISPIVFFGCSTSIDT